MISKHKLAFILHKTSKEIVSKLIHAKIPFNNPCNIFILVEIHEYHKIYDLYTI